MCWENLEKKKADGVESRPSELLTAASAHICWVEVRSHEVEVCGGITAANVCSIQKKKKQSKAKRSAVQSDQERQEEDEKGDERLLPKPR